MQLKKYEAPNIQEALRRIKAELGDDAVIFDLRTKYATSAGGDRPASTWVEVTAAIERSSYPAGGHAPHNREPIRAYAATPDDVGRFRSDAAPEFTAPCIEGFQDSCTWSATRCSPHLQNMLLSGFTREAAAYLIGEATATCAASNANEIPESALLRIIGRHVQAGDPITVAPGRQKKIAFVGPTGVGKTTTLAKIAARFAGRAGISVRIITIDTYRIAAAEQLKIYGAIMNVPVAVVANADELDRELRRCEDTQLVLIDTAGRNCRDTAQMTALGTWLSRFPDIETHLLLCATNTAQVLHSTVHCFMRNRIDRVIITKIDESLYAGHLYEILADATLPVSYITNGQRVPEDILTATGPLLAELLLHGHDSGRFAEHAVA